MPIHITDIDGDLGNLIVLSGVITNDEFTEAMQKHLTQDAEKYKLYRYSLTDLCNVTELDLSNDVIRDHSQACIQSAKINSDAVVAVVAPNDLSFGLSRMWEMLSEETSWEIRVFRDIDKARNWIRERVNERWDITGLTFSPKNAN